MPGPPWGAHPAVLHLDIDAFFASVEQLRHPALCGRPVAVGSGVVASASYEARACGVRAGTPLHDARRLCPELVVLSGHAPTYRAFAEQVFALAADVLLISGVVLAAATLVLAFFTEFSPDRYGEATEVGWMPLIGAAR